jgi:hypothetical protein
MRHPKAGPIPHVEVEEEIAASHKLEEFTRRIMSVPKKKIDAMLSRERLANKRRNGH